MLYLPDQLIEFCIGAVVWFLVPSNRFARCLARLRRLWIPESACGFRVEEGLRYGVIEEGKEAVVCGHDKQ
jgi:hypothetical protein